MSEDTLLSKVAKYGLFVSRLNNGAWMVGRANYIYHIQITQDHYADPNLSISRSLTHAVEQAIAKIGTLGAEDGAKKEKTAAADSKAVPRVSERNNNLAG